MPGPVAAASAKRRTDPARRYRRGSVKSALLQNSPHASLFLPGSQRHLRRRKLPPVRPWIARPVRNANEADAHLLPFHTALEEKKKTGGGVGRGWTEGGVGEKKKPLMPRLGCSSCSGAAASEGGLSGLKWVCRIRLHARRSRERQRFLSVSRSEPSRPF